MNTPHRMIVAVEGENLNNCVIMPGALRVEDDEIPVNWNGDNSKILGRASNLERDGNDVTMEITLNKDIYLDLEDKIGAFVYVQPFEGVPHPLAKGAIQQVTSGRIREVSLRDDL